MKNLPRWLNLTTWKLRTERFMGENEKKQMKEDLAVQEAVTFRS